jgi:predicted transcriptional regulator
VNESPAQRVLIDNDETNPVLTLGVLNAIEHNSAVTQRSISTQLGIALGLTNAYLKRCVRKGYIKVSQIPSRRYAYYLTPTGFAEKSRLAAEYFSQSFLFFREARSQCVSIFETCAARSWNRIALFGSGDLCDIARLCAHETGAQIIGVLDPQATSNNAAKIQAVAELSELPEFDAAVITDLRAPQAMMAIAAQRVSSDRIFVLPLLEMTAVAPKAVR